MRTSLVIISLGVMLTIGCGGASDPEAPAAAQDHESLDLQNLATRPTSSPYELLGQCMDADFAGQGTKVLLWTCNGGANQAWSLYPDGSLRPQVDVTKCLDLPNFDTTNGSVDLQTWDCNGGANQQWIVDPVYHSLRGYGGKCVDAPNFQSANGTNLDYWDCNGGTNQQFYFATPQFCTQQSGWAFQDFKNITSPPQWLPVYDGTGSTSPGLYCDNSCTYTRVFGQGNYGSCPF